MLATAGAALRGPPCLRRLLPPGRPSAHSPPGFRAGQPPLPAAAARKTWERGRGGGEGRRGEGVRRRTNGGEEKLRIRLRRDRQIDAPRDKHRAGLE
uniref:Uncharacterized protein n=1 Tax=Oryza sativa subsp. japonica TaxID=39947 RepID=Q8H5T9_ORYSJ|nr:hypothetical protein [Oryza sativa Japonica Group]